MNEKPLIILTAGGTGGHVMPAQALAAELIEREYRVQIITDARGMKYAKGFGDLKIHQIEAGTFGLGMPKLMLGILQSASILFKEKPAAIVGFGGYPAFPATFAGQLLGTPTVLHEQNAIFGKANKALAILALKIGLSWPNSRGLSKGEQKRAEVTGNPIRADIAKLAGHKYPEIKDTLNILVMGGSLGATVFSEVLPEAFANLSEDQKSRLNIRQQCREADLGGVKKAYAEANIKAELSTFIDDVPQALAKAHLFIGRSGASTVAEIGAAGLPAIFVPYPHHKDQQQKLNAESISEQGGAWTFTEDVFDSALLKSHIEGFLAEPKILKTAAAKSKACANPDAAAKLAKLVETVITTKG